MAFFCRKGVPESRNIIFKLMNASEITSLSQCSPVFPDYLGLTGASSA